MRNRGIWTLAAPVVAMVWAACSYDAGGFAASDGDGNDTGDDIGDLADAAPGAADAAPGLDATSAAPDAAPQTLQVHCPPFTPTGLEGEFADWTGIPKLGFDMADAALVTGAAGGYASSARVTFRCGHDATYLYVALEVTDDNLQVTTTDELYNDDAVAIFLDALGDAAGAYGDDDHEIYFRPSGAPNYADYGPAGPDLVVAGVVGPKTPGWVVEVGIHKSSLGLDVALPSTLGFDLGISDQDAAAAYAYGVWHVADRPVCATCCTTEPAARPWCDTTMFAQLVLE